MSDQKKGDARVNRTEAIEDFFLVVERMDLYYRRFSKIGSDRRIQKQ
jgi:hypothetical protein